MKSLLARFSNLPVWLKKHWWIPLLALAKWILAALVFFWHHIEQLFVNSWSWWSNMNVWWHHIVQWFIDTWVWFKNLNPWWYVLMFCVICAVLFLGLMRVETRMEKEEESKE